MWHISIKDLGIGASNLEATARRRLGDVGDVSAGEWVDMRPPFVHLRRRLTVAEQAPIGEAVDIRGTWEAEKRSNRVADALGVPRTALPWGGIADE